MRLVLPDLPGPTPRKKLGNSSASRLWGNEHCPSKQNTSSSLGDLATTLSLGGPAATFKTPALATFKTCTFPHAWFWENFESADPGVPAATAASENDLEESFANWNKLEVFKYCELGAKHLGSQIRI
jgi:hypothetical protein